MNKILSITLLGEFTNANTYINAERTHRSQASEIKQMETLRVKYETLNIPQIEKYPVRIVFNWYAKDKNVDPDNIAFAKKFILDGLQESKVLRGDGWKHISGFEDNFFIDKNNPRVEISFYET